MNETTTVVAPSKKRQRVANRTIVPPQLLGIHVSPYLNRSAWNALSVACEELNDTSNKHIIPPWPDNSRHDFDHVVNTVAFAPASGDDKLSVGLSDSTIHCMDRRLGRYKSVETGEHDDVTCLAYSRDGNLLASSDGNGIIRLWDTSDKATFRCLKAWSGDFKPVCTLAFSPDGKYLVTGSRGSTICFWRLPDGSRFRTLRGHSCCVSALSLSPDGLMLASASYDKTVRLWNLRKEAVNEKSKVLCAQEQWVKTVCFSPDGKYVACGNSDYSVQLWDCQKLGCVRTFRGHRDLIAAIVFSPDGSKLISGGDDRTIRIWNIATGKCERVLEGHTNQIRTVAVTSDGKTLASGGWDRTVRLWSI